MVWLPGGEKILKLCLQTDGRTDTGWRHRPHYA